MTANPRSDFSVCTTWGYHDGKWLLLEVFRQQLEFVGLAAAAKRLMDHWTPDYVLIERAASGVSLFQVLLQHDMGKYGLRERRPGRLIDYRPSVDKVVRFEAQTLKFEEGFCALPLEAPWLPDLKHELIGFPKARHDDQVDSISQFLDWAGSHRRRSMFDDIAYTRRTGLEPRRRG